MKVNTYQALMGSFGLVLFALLSLPVGDRHELGSAPTGGGGTRLTYSVINGCLVLTVRAPSPTRPPSSLACRAG